MPRVSIIIPVYNREDFIGQVIQSVLNQTYQDFEIIVVDDCSTDKTKEIVKTIQAKDKRIRLIELEKNSGGPSRPTNIGIQNAKSHFISILESDDLYLPNFLETKLEHIDKNNLDWSIGSAFYIFSPSLKFNKYVKGASVSTWMLKKMIFEKTGYFKEEQNGVQDTGFSLRVSKLQNVKIGLLANPLTICFIHSQSYSYFLDNIEKKINLFRARLKSVLEDASGLRDWQALLYWRIGNYYCLSGKLQEGRKWFQKSIKSKFNKIAILLFLLSFLRKNLYLKFWKILWFIKNVFFEKIKFFYIITFKYQKEYLIAKKILNSLKIKF